MWRIQQTETGNSDVGTTLEKEVSRMGAQRRDASLIPGGERKLGMAS